MINRIAAVVCVVLWLEQVGYVDAKAAMQVQPLQSAQTYRPPSSTDLRVVLLGTEPGPTVTLDQFGVSTLVEAAGMRLLFDCGRGATFRLAQANIPLGSITRLFLTHLHSDHIVQIPDLFLVGWSGRNVPLEVWGPEGTREMMRALQQAFAFDIRMRRPSTGTLPKASGSSVRTSKPRDA
jgi:ribonuclease Z